MFPSWESFFSYSDTRYCWFGAFCIAQKLLRIRWSNVSPEISGTAIGTVTAVVYSIIYMYKFEVGLIATYPLKRFVWWRFYEISAVWTRGETELLRFVAHLNSVNPWIKFTLQYPTASVNFLDVTSDPTRILSTDLDVKSTDTHQFLHSNSCHPNHTKKGRPGTLHQTNSTQQNSIATVGRLPRFAWTQS